jgi:tetratricopeptide (TPR) repeat protein
VTEDEALQVLRGDDPRRAAAAEAALWRLWCESGVPAIDALLRQGVEAMERGDLAGAEALFTRIIEQAPGFAEGWNKRATVRYVAGNPAASIADCRETLARKPHHFGALSGQGLCHMALGQYAEAAALFRRALEVHPRLPAVQRNLGAAMLELVRANGHPIAVPGRFETGGGSTASSV